jgi:hypothetical protein
MLRFSALVPDATVNYVKNPAMRYDTTGWTSAGSTISRVLDFARFGIASLKVVTAGTALRQGAFYRVLALAGVSEPITVSAYVRGTGKVRIRLINNPTGMEWASASIQLETDRWYRLSVSGFSTGSDDLRLYVETDDSVATARTFYVDGAQMERKSYPTTYCDGEQPGCRWNGTYHSSTSQRPSNTRAGGRWVQLAGKEREAQDLYMTVAGGLGAAPLHNNIQSFALSPGAFHQGVKVQPRPITLTFHAKHKVDSGSTGAGDRDEPVSLAYLHQLRQLLIDIVKPDRTGGSEEIWFEYDDGNTPLYFQARYEAGLEGEWDVRNQFVNSFPLRLLAVSPFMLEDSQEVAVLDFQEVIRPNRVVGRVNGQWNILNYGMSDIVYKMALGKNGEVYAVGSFVTANNNALATDPLRTVNGVAYWDGEKWNPLGTGMNVPATPCDIAVAPNGNVYVTGNFTTIGGVAANRIAFWNGSAWNAMGTGLNSSGYTLKIAPNGDVYVGGAFTTAGGVTVNYIARWDGFQWRRLGQFGGMDAFVYSIDMTPDGSTLYVGGDFAGESNGSGLLNFVGSYNTATGLFSPMGNGFNTTVRVVRLAKSGIVYAGGNFTTSQNTLQAFSRVAMWTGSSWVAMSSGVSGGTGIVWDIRIFNNEEVLIVGWFTTAGGKPARGMVLWNGSTFFNTDGQIDTTTTDALHSGLTLPNGDFYVGGTTFVGTGNMKVSGFTTVTNPGTTEVRPIIYVLGPGTLRWIENQTTGKRIFLNLSVLTNEDVFFDFGRGDIYSTVRGSLLYALLPGSDFRSFSLLPGDNRIACFMVDDVNAQMQISFVPQHWSADATQHGEAL